MTTPIAGGGEGGEGDPRPPRKGFDGDGDTDDPGEGGTTPTTEPGGHRVRRGETQVTVGGHPALTSATTTANLMEDPAADQSDEELQSFFGSGHGFAPHYYQTLSGGIGQEEVVVEPANVRHQQAGGKKKRRRKK